MASQRWGDTAEALPSANLGPMAGLGTVGRACTTTLNPAKTSCRTKSREGRLPTGF